MERLGIPHKTLAAVEFDKKTMDCYNVIHGTNFEPSDITTLDPQSLPECDMICYSPPCQSFSVAGNNEGINDPRGTLFWNALKIIEAKKPKYALMENVKNLTGKRHRETFDSMLKSLESIGYTNYWKVLNAKNYGTPQNRERVFVVSIRNDLDTKYSFPEPFDNGVRLRDVLEDEVDDKFYIDDAKATKLLEECRRRDNSLDYSGLYTQNSMAFFRGALDGISRTLKSNSHDAAVIIPNEISVVGPLAIKGNDQIRRMYLPDGIAPTLNTCEGGNRQSKIVVVNHGSAKVKSDDISTCIDANYWKGLDNHGQRTAVLANYRIRKLTPLECLRLQAFDDADCYALRSHNISNSQIYKVAGNSIAVCVLEEIFKELLKEVKVI